MDELLIEPAEFREMLSNGQILELFANATELFTEDEKATIDKEDRKLSRVELNHIQQNKHRAKATPSNYWNNYLHPKTSWINV
jgi:spore germination protein GerM